MRNNETRFPVEIWSQDSTRAPLVYDLEAERWGIPVNTILMMPQGMTLSHITRCYVRVNGDNTYLTRQLATMVLQLEKAFNEYAKRFPDIGVVQSFTNECMWRAKDIREGFVAETTDRYDIPIAVHGRVYYNKKWMKYTGDIEKTFTPLIAQLLYQQCVIHISAQEMQIFIKQFIDCFVEFDTDAVNMLKYNYQLTKHKPGWEMLNYLI